MLVLSLEREQGIVLGDPENPLGRVVCLDIKGDKVRLGFENFPPREKFEIHRDPVATEIVKERKKEREEASKIAPPSP